MKKLLALINWPSRGNSDDYTAEEPDLPVTKDSLQPQHNPEGDTQPMYRIGNRDPKDIQKMIDLAG